MRIFGPKETEPWKSLAFASRQLGRRHDDENADARITLDDVKTAFLLALLEYTNFPGRRAWLRVGHAVRLAISARIHCVDIPNHPSSSSHTAEEQEERRMVLWAVWRLDTSINILAGTPFSLDTLDISTALPSVSTATFTYSSIPPSLKDFLPETPSKPWHTLQDLLRNLSREAPIMYYDAVSYNREAVIRRRRLRFNPTLELMREVKDFKKVLPFLKEVLPAFFSPTIDPSQETVERHRTRLETLVLLQMYALLPLLNRRSNPSLMNILNQNRGGIIFAI